MNNNKLDRRKFLTLTCTGTAGFILSLAIHDVFYEDDAEAVNWLAVIATGVSLVNGLFALGENIRGLLELRNDSGTTKKGYVKYEIFDVNRNFREVSEGTNVIAYPGYNSINFSCTGCQTSGPKYIEISTGYNKIYSQQFNVGSLSPDQRNPSYCHSHYPYGDHCHLFS